MRYEDLDRTLSTEPEIVPSPGFVVSVMYAVQREAAAPSIPFPWKRALPGLCAAALAIVWVPVAILALFIQETPNDTVPVGSLPALAVIAQVWNTVGAGWMSLAFTLSLASVKLSKLAARKSQ